jgi:hypothetical protein
VARVRSLSEFQTSFPDETSCAGVLVRAALARRGPCERAAPSLRIMLRLPKSGLPTLANRQFDNANESVIRAKSC